MKKFPILHKLAKTGTPLFWKIEIENDGKFPIIHRSSWILNGKTKNTDRIIRKGTNIGKSNEKSSFENAEFIAGNMWQKKLEDNFVENIKDIYDPPKYVYPMLAANYNEKKIKFPVYIQPKMDGARCVSFHHLGDNRMISRQRKEFKTIEHIRTAVDDVFGPELSPDGEVYCPNTPLQTQMSWLKKEQLKTKNLEYWIYDLAIPNLSFKDRHQILSYILSDDHLIIKKVETYKVNSIKEIEKLHDDFVRKGFEGAIIRDPEAEYGFNDRPVSLMKVKKFKDDEFKIIDFETEEFDNRKTGKIDKLVLWRCDNGYGKIFRVRPKGSFTERKKAYKTAKDQIGKMITVKYQALTNEKIPQFPIGLIIRDYE